jgi:RIO-like serine/threonine protein kinase
MTDLEQFEDFKEVNPILYELLIKHYKLEETGCIHRAYQEYYVLMKNKECTLLDFYHTEDLKYLRVEPEIDCLIEFSKEYFLSNTFIFENVSSNESIMYFKNKDVYFYIIQNFGSGGDYDCCASIVLRYKNT